MVFFVLKKYFKKYKTNDLFWIVFVFLTAFYCSNKGLYHLTNQTISLDGCLWGIPLFLFQFLAIDKFIICKRK